MKKTTWLLIGLLCVLGGWQWPWQISHTEDPRFYFTDLKQPVEKAFVNSLWSAKKSICLSVYALNSNKVIEALRSQAAAGVDVEVITDKNTQKNLARRLGPNVKITLLEGRGLMHYKIAVIDNEISWVGSANYTGESLRVHSNLMQKIDSKEVASALIEKMRTLSALGSKKRIGHKAYSLNGQKIELWFLPDDQGASLYIKDLMRSAKKSIRVAMYTFTRLDFADTLLKASQRGVKVEVILDRSMLEGASKRVKDLFNKTLVNVSVSDGTPLLHHKMMIIDEYILVHGSANWTKAAFTQNEDYFIVLYDLTSDQNKELNRLWQSLINRSS